MDNEGDGLADCADPDCDPEALCVPSSADQPAGVVVAEDEPCPAGFTGGETVIHRGLQPSACVGCGCTPGDTTCVGEVWIYDDSNDCSGDVAQSGGVRVTVPITTTCTANPLTYDFLKGIRANITATSTCTANGTGVPATSTWAESVKFCRTSAVALGCSATAACVPRAEQPESQCAIADGAATCDSGYATTEADWYTDFEDERTCGACFCTPVGGDCANVLVEVGSDYTCGNHHTVGDDTKLCLPGIGEYSPPARLIGAPTAPTGCTADAPFSGDISPTGQTTLCCQPS
jgi:hypothetical protein